jgi:WD40 repeat protein
MDLNFTSNKSGGMISVKKVKFGKSKLPAYLKISSLLVLLFPALFSQIVFSQGSNYDYERVKIGDVKHIVVGMDMSPDQKYLAISGNQSFPCYIFDWSKREIKTQYDVGNWYAGSSVKYSSGGKYLLLQQLYYMDWAPNKDREVNFEVIHAESGSVVKRFEKIHAAAFTPDEQYIVTLVAGEVSFWNLETGNKDKSFNVNLATNGVAVSPDGKHIAVSHRPDADELKKRPDYKKNKKAYQNTAKYKQEVSIFETETFKKVITVNEFYDIVYKLEYSGDGITIFCMNIPHVNIQTSAERLTYISTINAETGNAQRKGFTSKALYEPDFKLSHDGRLMGVISQSTKFLELHIYDFETGKMLKRFELSYRLFEKNEGDMIIADSRASFVFLPDNKSVFITMGNHLVLWEMKLNE